MSDESPYDPDGATFECAACGHTLDDPAEEKPAECPNCGGPIEYIDTSRKR
jgi:rubrerythrin